MRHFNSHSRTVANSIDASTSYSCTRYSCTCHSSTCVTRAHTSLPTPGTTFLNSENQNVIVPEPGDSTTTTTTTPLLRRQPRSNLFDYISFTADLSRSRACVDASGTFMVDLQGLHQGMESCAWLKQNPEFIPRLCLIGNEFDDNCRKTCDNCME